MHSALVLREQTRILLWLSATRLVWIAVILDSSETNGPLLNSKILLVYSLEVHVKSFGGQKGGSNESPGTSPLAYHASMVLSMAMVLLYNTNQHPL